MKTNKEKVLEFIKDYSKDFKNEEYPKLTTQFLSEKLGLQRTNLSSILNQLVKEGYIKKILGRPVFYQLILVSEEMSDDFNGLIGYDQSLKEAVMLAKAAVLYPHGSPHILLSAESGSGISKFTKAVYGFAMQSRVLKTNAPFIIFDCKSYIENNELMSLKLFGSQLEYGLLHNANQGLLLIKHAELLNDYMRNLLFQSWESKKFSSNHKELPGDYKCILICSISHQTNQNILEAYKTRFSYFVDLPDIYDRTLLERYQFIEAFLKEEAIQLQRIITMHSSVLNSLMLYKPNNQIRGLRNDIHNACANSYARYRKNQKSIELLLSDFVNDVRKGMIHYKSYKEEIDKIITQNINYAFTNKEVLKNNVAKNDNIYQTIDQKKKNLKKQSMSEEEINTLVSLDLQSDFENYFNKLTTNIDSIQKLEKVVSSKLIQIVSKFLKEASQKLNKIFDEKILFGLCLHINALIIPLNDKQRISPEERKRLIDLFPKYYHLSQSLVNQVEKEFNITISSDEKIFIMLFMMSGYEFTRQKKVSTLIALHGNQAAFSITEVIKTLTQKDNIYSYDLSLDKSMSVVYEELKQSIIEANQGKGIILIYDMGSIRTMADSIMVETGIEICYIEMPITLLGMVSVNKSNENCSLEEAHNYLKEKFKDIQYIREQQSQEALIIISPIRKEIETVFEYLNKKFDLSHFKIFTLNKSHLGEIYNEIDRISQQNSITGIISSYNLHLSQFAFLKIQDLFQKNVQNITDLFKENDELNEIFEYLQEQFLQMNVEELKQPLIRFLDEVTNVLNIKMDMNQRIGLLIHLICLIDKLQKHASPSVNFMASQIIIKDSESVQIVKTMLKDIEEIANIYISDTEVATIISIIKQE